MLYLIVDSAAGQRPMLVKADSEADVKDKLNLKDTQTIAGSFTNADMTALDDSAFAVVSG